MKHILLLTLCCMLAGIVRAATVSGTVTNLTTASPASGQVVYVTDSNKSFTDSAVTNGSGFYSITLPAVSPRVLTVTVSACGTLQNFFPFFNGSTNIVVNMSICPPTITLHGTVSLGSTANNGLATVYLILKQYDSTVLDTTLTAIDSINTAATGGAYSKTYTFVPSGTLLLKAALKSSHPLYASYLPTYYDSAIVWSNALQLSPANFSSSNATNIDMTAGINPGGPGFIGGSVLVGANKATAVGDPLGNRVLLLTNSAGQAVAYTYSGANGQFQFPNLAYGTYKIFGDAWGKSNPALTVTITSFRPSITDVLFEENDKTFKGTIPGLSVGAHSALSGVSLYPNPATDYIQFKGLSAISGDKTVVLSDVTGAAIYREVIEQNGAARMSTAALPAGIYILRLQTSEGAACFKMVK